MPNIRDEIAKTYEQKQKERRAQEAIAARQRQRLAASIAVAPPVDDVPAAPAIQPEKPSEFNQFTEFQFIFPRALIKLIAFCHLLFAITGMIYFAQAGEWGRVALMPVVGVMLTAGAVAGTFIQWIVAYIGYKFFWWFSGCAWVVVALVMFYAVMMAIAGQLAVPEIRWPL